MRAVVQDRYGPPEVLRIEEVDKPLPKDDEVLIRVRASTVSQTDTHLRAARPFFWRFFVGLRRPRIRTLGVELSGEVEAVGAAVREFKVGDAVFGGPRGFGTHAEYICLRESAPITQMPAGMSFEDAAAVSDGTSEALATLRKAEVAEGTRLVIYGASGSLGTAAVQIAKHLGAHVTAVCSTSNVEIVRSLGADEVIDYTKEDFTKSSEKYDAIIDAVGKYAYHWGRRGLKPGGIYVETDLGPHKLETLLMVVLTRWFGTKRLRFAGGWRNKPDIIFAKGLIEAGKYRPVIDSRYPMDQVVEAHRRVETWQKRGNVVLVISGDIADSTAASPGAS
jgi:NADPH:quinone reductase-like Zn-dependent oxidoreductase